MAILKRITLISLCSMACNTGLVPSDYRGEAVFTVEGLVNDFRVGEDLDAKLSAGLFWSTIPTTTTNPQLLAQHGRSAVAVEFPARFTVNVFGPPEEALPSRPYEIGQLLVFDDRDGDQRMDPGELRGGAPFHAVIYTSSPIDRQRSPTRRALPAGFSLVTLPLPCDAETSTRGVDRNDCGVALGATCSRDEDCGGLGTCLSEPFYIDFRGGYCALPEASTTCTPAGGTTVGFFDFSEETVTNLWLKACETDADCRNDQECQFGLEACLGRSPIFLDIDRDFEMFDLCIDASP